MRPTHFFWLFLLSTASAAQNWCPPGAVWDHTYSGCFGCNDTGYVRTVYARDTIIMGSTCQVLDVTKHRWTLGSGIYSEQDQGQLITHGQEDLVEKWNGTSYDTLFCFAASPGDSWDMIGLGWGLVTVLDTGHALVNGASLRYLVLDLGEGSTGPPQDTVYARMGFLSYYLDGYSPFFFDSGLEGLRCYKDNEFDYSTGTDPACDFTLAASEYRVEEHCRPFPNPGNDHFSIAPVHSGVSTLNVFDAIGRNILQNRSICGSTAIDASTWPRGVFLVVVNGRDGLRRTFRWVKQ